MQENDRKFDELMKNMAYHTKVLEKEKVSLENKQGEPLIFLGKSS